MLDKTESEDKEFTAALDALDSSLSTVDHEDPDKHYIGAALPVASDNELRPVGVNTTAGASPYPARADHIHAISLEFTRNVITGRAITPSTYTVLTDWTYQQYSGSSDWLDTGDDNIVVPYDGLYIVGTYATYTPTAAGWAGSVIFSRNALEVNSVIHRYNYQGWLPASVGSNNSITIYYNQLLIASKDWALGWGVQINDANISTVGVTVEMSLLSNRSAV